MKLDEGQLAEIRAREQAATPGPWSDAGAFILAPPTSDGHAVDICYGIADPRWPADAAFIAHARTDVARLLAEVDRLRGIGATTEDLGRMVTIDEAMAMKNRRIADLESQLAVARAEVRRLVAEGNLLRRWWLECDEKAKNLESQLAAAREEVRRLAAEGDSLRLCWKDADDKFRAERERAETLAQRLEQLRDELGDLREQLAAAKGEP